MRTYIFIFLGMFIFFSCNKKEEKKEEKKPTEQVVDSVPAKKEVTKQVKKAPELVFTVQVAALKRTNSALANLANVKVMSEDGLSKYRLQSFTSYQEAKNYKKKIQSEYPDAFIQALKNGKPINIKEALK